MFTNTFLQVKPPYFPFHKKFSIEKALKNLRNNRNGKLEQGNILDIFIRRCLLTFTKWSFSDLVRFYNELQSFKIPGFSSKLSTNPFSFEKRLEDLKNTIENSSINSCKTPSKSSNFDGFSQEISSLKSLHYSSKLDFLQFKAQAKEKKPLLALENLHKYFDKSLNFLLQAAESPEKPGQTSNKINHAILSLSQMNFTLGFFDEVLRGVSEALRISQNNSDDESINHCLCYLYQIAGIFGNFEDQISLLEYAISHSLNLNNPNLMLFSCLYYSTLERFSDVKGKGNGFLHTRNISWTNALHYSSKKLITSHESGLNLKEISQEKGLMTPRALEWIVLALSLNKLAKPNAANLALSIVYGTSRKNVLFNEKVAIQLYEGIHKVSGFDWVKGVKLMKEGFENNEKNENFTKEKIQNGSLEKSYFLYYWYLINYEIFLQRGMYGYCDDMEELIVVQFRELHEIALYSVFWAKINERLLMENKFEEAFYSGFYK